MSHRITGRVTLLVLALAAFAPKLSAQKLHTNNRWKQCAIVLDSSLTPGAWRQFTSELGLVTYFRPLVSAKPMGRGHFEMGVLNAGTQINNKDAAWNDTFSHPDSTHWLFEGSALYIPGVTARAGVTDRLDVGGYITHSIGANYGWASGQLQYELLNDSRRHLAAAGRLSVVHLFGPADMSANTLGLDLIASREFSRWAPYVGVSGYVARSHETSPNVDLADATEFGAQGTLGVAASIAFVRLGAEYSIARVPGMAMKITMAR